MLGPQCQEQLNPLMGSGNGGVGDGDGVTMLQQGSPAGHGEIGDGLGDGFSPVPQLPCKIYDQNVFIFPTTEYYVVTCII